MNEELRKNIIEKWQEIIDVCKQYNANVDYITATFFSKERQNEPNDYFNIYGTDNSGIQILNVNSYQLQLEEEMEHGMGI